VRKAEEAAKNAYAPYSNYPVGAVVRTTDGREFAGVNVENAAYPLTQCAEKTALGAAAAAGYRPGDIAAVGINASPCGGCRERMQGRVDETMSSDVDAVMIVVNARERIGAGDRYVARRVFQLGVPVVIVVNKVDRLKPGHIATQMKVAASFGEFHALHPVSAM